MTKITEMDYIELTGQGYGKMLRFCGRCGLEIDEPIVLVDNMGTRPYHYECCQIGSCYIEER